MNSIFWECPLNRMRREATSGPVDPNEIVIFPVQPIENIVCGACQRPYCMALVEDDLVQTKRKRMKLAKKLCRDRVKWKASIKRRRAADE